MFEAIPTDPRAIAIEDDLRDVFAVHDIRIRGEGKVIVLAGRFLRSPALVFEHAQSRLAERGMIPLLRQEQGKDFVIAQPAPQAAGRRRVWINVVLLGATIVSVLGAGAMQSLPESVWQGMDLGSEMAATSALAGALLEHWRLGIPFAAALLGILGVHELGHYFLARHYKLDVSLPYFIPFPLNYLTGTLGAVIRIESPFQSRRALFDVGIAGPLAGMAVALPVVAAGLAQAQLVQIDLSAGGMVFQEPLLFRWMAELIVGPRPPGFDLEMNPLLMAGWWGFLVTALNLLPVSQLDGGHISYAVFGKHHTIVAWSMFGLAAVVALAKSPGYLLMLGLVFLMGLNHPPALDDVSSIGTPRRILGLLTLLLFFLLATPQPLTPVGP